jgi:hypothetical protein
LEKKI